MRVRKTRHAALSEYRIGVNGPLGTCTMAASAASSSQIFSVNPYENHPSLTQIEADVLWEYAKLNQHIKDVRIYTFDRESRPIDMWSVPPRRS
jgi:hypothetical protein